MFVRTSLNRKCQIRRMISEAYRGAHYFKQNQPFQTINISIYSGLQIYKTFALLRIPGETTHGFIYTLYTTA